MAFYWSQWESVKPSFDDLPEYSVADLPASIAWYNPIGQSFWNNFLFCKFDTYLRLLSALKLLHCFLSADVSQFFHWLRIHMMYALWTAILDHLFLSFEALHSRAQSADLLLDLHVTCVSKPALSQVAYQKTQMKSLKPAEKGALRTAYAVISDSPAAKGCWMVFKYIIKKWFHWFSQRPIKACWINQIQSKMSECNEENQ